MNCILHNWNPIPENSLCCFLYCLHVVWNKLSKYSTKLRNIEGDFLRYAKQCMNVGSIHFHTGHCVIFAVTSDRLSTGIILYTNFHYTSVFESVIFVTSWLSVTPRSLLIGEHVHILLGKSPVNIILFTPFTLLIMSTHKN